MTRFGEKSTRGVGRIPKVQSETPGVFHL